MNRKVIKAQVVGMRRNIRARAWKSTCEKDGHYKNVTVALCDGKTAFKMTLFSHLARRVTEGNSYVFAHFMAETNKPNVLLCQKSSKIYVRAEVKCSDALRAEARALIFPPSLAMPLSEVIRNPLEGLVNVEGQVESMRPIRMVRQRGNNLAPFRALTLKKDEAAVKIGLWREANLVELKVGGSFVFTHLSARVNDSGVMLHSTTFTEIKACNSSLILNVCGILYGEEVVEVVSDSGEVTSIKLEIWQKTFSQPPKIPQDGLAITVTRVQDRSLAPAVLNLDGIWPVLPEK
ncbi:uncharacterized protein ACBT44_012332 isoform 1-T2 [Syngnathus typhle]